MSESMSKRKLMVEEEDDDSLETPKQLAARVGLSPWQIKQLIATGQLECVHGCRKYMPRSAWPRFLDRAKTVKPWQDETRVLGLCAAHQRQANPEHEEGLCCCL